MPWGESSVSDEKTKFIAALLDGQEMTEACREFGISRKTGYKWWVRYSERGPEGLKDQSRAPHRCPHRVGEELVKAILELRRKQASWGPKKLKQRLTKLAPDKPWPSRSTFAAVLHRHGLVAPRTVRQRIPAYQRPFIGAGTPNAIWTADFKGDFRTADGTRCYPLTIADCCSRYLLRCQALTSTAAEQALPVFEAAFKEYGLPLAIRTDNGVPFATTTLARLSSLSAWWVRLGVMPQFIEPGKPQQNGRHERMHRTLKAETTRPAAATLQAQQRRFNAFRAEFNHERPHEALEQATPASFYHPSPRPMPDRLPPLIYPDRFEVRYVSGNGGIRWERDWVNVSIVCAGEYVGLEEIDDGVWNVYFGALRLGRLHERHMRIEDADGRLKRR